MKLRESLANDACMKARLALFSPRVDGDEEHHQKLIDDAERAIRAALDAANVADEQEMELRDLAKKDWRVESSRTGNTWDVLEALNDGEHWRIIAVCIDRETAAAIAALPTLCDLAWEVANTKDCEVNYLQRKVRAALDAATVADEQEGE